MAHKVISIGSGKVKLNTLQTVKEELTGGGNWLGAARTWMQSNIKDGDSLGWSSTKCVSVRFCDLQDFAKEVATHAVYADREHDHFKLI